MNTSANRNSFQASVKVNTAAATRPGAAIGSSTSDIDWRRLAPSIWAASSISGGIPLKYPISIQVQNGIANVW